MPVLRFFWILAAWCGGECVNKPEFETTAQAAVRLGVTKRAVQKWAAEGRIPGAVKHGNSWLIPQNAVVTKSGESGQYGILSSIPDVYQLDPFRISMPLLNSSYPIGKIREYINAISDEDDRNIALGEYFFFSGYADQAVEILEPYLNSPDPSLRFSSNLICSFANLSRGHIQLARFSMNQLHDQLQAVLHSEAPPHLHAIGIFTAHAASVLLHRPIPDIPRLDEYLYYLPGGLKLYACYILAHRAYLEGDYQKSLNIADLGIAFCPNVYPIASVYVHIIAAIALINLKRIEEAKRHIDSAWKIAKPDDILEPFGEHHGLLQGLIEIYFRDHDPEVFERMNKITYAFSAGWRKIHNPDTNHPVADNLTTTEFTVAMLYNRGWLKKEIAAHMGVSFHTVNAQIKTIFNKLGISNKDELGQYMLQ